MARIYVSSTFIDLKEFRHKVSQAIRRAKHEDVAMEYYVAEDRRPVDRCLADVSRCDVYLGIFAWRYGWVPRNKNRKRFSITEMEYRQALAAGKPCLVFLLDEGVPWAPGWIDDDRTQIRRLRAEIAEKHGGDVFMSGDELGQRVAEALHRWALHSGAVNDAAIDIGRRAAPSTQFLDEVSLGARYDGSAVDAFRGLLRPEHRRDFPLGMTPLQFLERNGLVVSESLTRTGILLFHSNPDARLSSAVVQCAVFDGEDRNKLSATSNIRGTVPSQIVACLDFVANNTKHVDDFVPGLSRTIRLDQYPMKCLREVLANALCHRDYSDLARNVHLRLFPGRIEILSPGEWMGATKIEGRTQLESVRSESITRNSTLAKLLTWIRLVEREGSGIRRALSDCTENRAPMPMIESKNGFVAITIYPSETFVRVARGESSDQKATKAAMTRAAEDEQVIVIGSHSTAADRLEALRAYSRRNRRSAFRVLRQIKDLPPTAVLSFLGIEAGWDGEDLGTYVSNWIYEGGTREEVSRLLLEFVGATHETRVIAYVYFAIQQNALPIERIEFFNACRRPLRNELKVDAVDVADPTGSLTFMMGSIEAYAEDDERPVHEVELSPYRLGRTPITSAEYAAFTGDPSGSTSPVVSVSWWEAWIFCEWVGGALPTEAQWECACRAGTTTAWWTGDDERALTQAAWVDEEADGEAHPVKQKAANPWGLFDVHGNVSEWCFDRYGPYVGGRCLNPSGPRSGRSRVIRGGNAAAPPDRSRSARRDHALPDRTSLVGGFRVAFNS